jgi:hypothetical protein
MKKLSFAAAFVGLVVAISAFAVYETAGSAQHRQPAQPTQSAPPAQAASPSQPQQPSEAHPAPQGQPRGGHTAPAGAPTTGQAVPRAPDGGVARNEPDRQRPRPRGPVVIPYPVGPWWGYPYPYPPYGGWRVYADWAMSYVRIDVEPKDAQVYVDGYFAGVVDDYNGIFQHLTLRPGPHLIEIRKTGYVSLAVELNLYPGQSVTYRRTMEPSTGETAPPVSVPIAPAFEEGALPPAAVDLPPGDVKFDVSPKDAEIYADGFYAGIVDDFNGSQHLELAPGRHHIELKMNGYETVVVEVSIESGRSITYRAALKKLN